MNSSRQDYLEPCAFRPSEIRGKLGEAAGPGQQLNTECRSPGWKQLAAGKDIHGQAVGKDLGL